MKKKSLVQIVVALLVGGAGGALTAEVRSSKRRQSQ